MEWDITTESGFEEMYREYFPKLYNYIFYRILSKQDTEDIISEVFMKVARNAHTYDAGKAAFKTWIYTITKNCLTDHYRRRRPVLSLDDSEAGIEPSVDFEQQLEMISSEKRRELYRQLSTLKERERLIIYYKYFEGYNNRQIAMLLDMNERTVGTIIFRTLRKLDTPQMKRLMET